jgi:spore maturation protein A
MKLIGNVLQYLLNINAIWGLMILSALLLCVVQHYQPTTTTIPGDKLVEGKNVVTLRTIDKKGQEHAFAYCLTRKGDALTPAEKDRQPSRARPWIVGIQAVGTGFLLTWDSEMYGKFRVGLGDQLGLVQADRPTAQVPRDGLVEGENVFSIATTDHEGRDHLFTYGVVLRDGVLTISPSDQLPSKTRPWLVSAEPDPSGSGFVLTWDSEAFESYTAILGDRAVAVENLVTLDTLTDAALDYATGGFELALGLVATMVLFLGLMKVGQDAGVVQLFARVFHPIIRLLFPDVPKEHPANGAILMNVTTTVLGLGNAATPFGLKAMKELQTLNPHKKVATDAQVMLLAYNTAGLAILPTMLLAMRKAAGCKDPFEIIGTCLIAGATATLVAIILSRVLPKLPFFSREAAVAEFVGEQKEEPPSSPLPEKDAEGRDE